MKKPLIIGTFLASFLLEPLSLQSREGQTGSQEVLDRFGVEVNYIEVNAVVTDGEGNFVLDLDSEDFEIYEDGKLQEIANFTFVDIPVERFEPFPFVDEVEPDVRSNASEGRVYVIVLDDSHTEARRSERVQRDAREFIEEHLGANDIAAVAYTSGRADASQEFTTSKPLLLAAVDRFLGRKLRSATLEKLEDALAHQAKPGGVPRELRDPWEGERVQRVRNTLGILEELSESLADVHGRRKAIVYFGEGMDYKIDNIFEVTEATTIIESTRRTIGAATRANAAIYTIDPRGLSSASQGPEAFDKVPTDFADRIESPSVVSALQEEITNSQNSLRVIAEETGGFAVLNQNDYTTGLARVVEENSRYYLMGYYPRNEDKDGEYRKIEVRVDRPDVEVRARKGYWAPGEGDKKEVAEIDVSEGASRELRPLIQSPLPVPGIAMQATASPLRIGKERAVLPLVVEMSIEGFRFEEREGSLHDKVEFSAVAIDGKGEAIAAVRRDFQLSLPPRGYRLMVQAGLRVMTALEIPSGKYQLRIAAWEAGAGKGGSLFYDVEIPDYGKSDFVMTPLVVTSNVESLVPVFATEEDKQKALLIPTTRRAFSRQDSLVVLAEFYPPRSGSGPSRVEVTTTIKATDEKTVFNSTEVRGGEELGEGIIHRVEIALADVPPGDYLLEMRARETSKESEVIRQVVIEIF